MNGDGRDELFAVPLGGRRVSLYGPLGGEAFRSFEPFGAEAGSGVTIAAGDVLGDSRPELVAAAATGAGVEVRVVDIGSGRILATYRPFDAPAVAPEVAVGDVDGDGRADVVVMARLPDGTKVRALDAAGARVADFFVLDAGIVPGASLAAGDLDGDKQAEIVLGGGPTTSPWPPVANGPDQRVAVYAADGSRIGGFAAYPGLFQGGVRVALGDVDGDRRPETITAPGPGMEPEIGVFSQTWNDANDRGTRLAHFLAFEPSFRGGVHVAAGDLDGDGATELVVGAGPGRLPEVRIFDWRGRLRRSFLAFEPTYAGGISVGAGDLNADGRAEIVAGTLTAPARFRAFDEGAAVGPVIAPFPSGAAGVDVAVADIAGTGRGLVLAASAGGDSPTVALVDPFTGSPRETVERRLLRGANGLSVAAGDFDRDGRDELVLAPRWSGGASVEVLNGRFTTLTSFTVYPSGGFGVNVATAARIGLPLVSFARTPRFRAGVRTRVVVARFRDAAGAASRRPVPRDDRLGRRHPVERRRPEPRRWCLRRPQQQAVRACRRARRHGDAHGRPRPHRRRTQYRRRQAEVAADTARVDARGAFGFPLRLPVPEEPLLERLQQLVPLERDHALEHPVLLEHADVVLQRGVRGLEAVVDLEALEHVVVVARLVALAELRVDRTAHGPDRAGLPLDPQDDVLRGAGVVDPAQDTLGEPARGVELLHRGKDTIAPWPGSPT